MCGIFYFIKCSLTAIFCKYRYIVRGNLPAECMSLSMVEFFSQWTNCPEILLSLPIIELQLPMKFSHAFNAIPVSLMDRGKGGKFNFLSMVNSKKMTSCPRVFKHHPPVWRTSLESPNFLSQQPLLRKLLA